jgi:serine/threonine protein kinase
MDIFDSPILGYLKFKLYCGSAEYMSPEMLKGEPYSYGIDYYSLGAVLYEMVTGLPPFYSTDQSEMFQAAL